MTERYTTTDGGAPAPSDDQSLTIGPDGPILLQDHYLIEQMAMFNRERIPERQPHAKGGGAFGHFQVTNDVRKYTTAAVFQPGHLAGSAWVRVEVLHVGGQLRHGRQQHPGLLHARSAEVPALYPVTE